MAYGTINVDTLTASTGVLATQNGMTGIAKAWVNFVGSTAVINASFNVSSVTRTAAGNYTINFTTAMPNANYSVCAMGNNPQAYNNIGSTITTSALQILSYYLAALTDQSVQTVMIIGS